jgi:hypothetical protein
MRSRKRKREDYVELGVEEKQRAFALQVRPWGAWDYSFSL